jgi:hypothetical protein
MSNLNQSKSVSSYTAFSLKQHCSLWVKCKSFFICALIILNSCSGGGPDYVYPSSESLSKTPQVVFRDVSNGSPQVLQAEEKECFEVNSVRAAGVLLYMCGQSVRFGHGIQHPLDHTHSVEALYTGQDLHRIQFLDCDFKVDTDQAKDEDFTIQLYGSSEQHRVVSLKPMIYSDESVIDSIYYSTEHGMLRIFVKTGTTLDRVL